MQHFFMKIGTVIGNLLTEAKLQFRSFVTNATVSFPQTLCCTYKQSLPLSILSTNAASFRTRSSYPERRRYSQCDQIARFLLQYIQTSKTEGHLWVWFGPKLPLSLMMPASMIEALYIVQYFNLNRK